MDESAETSINDLPEFVLLYLLSLVSPYNDLKNCMLVSKYWCYLVRDVIHHRKKDFIQAIRNRTVVWEHVVSRISDTGPVVSKRYAHSSCLHQNALYVFGGCTYSNTTFNDLWRHDLNSREWIRPLTTGTYPSPKALSSMVSYKDDIWVYGGWTHPSPYPLHQGLQIYSELHSYNSANNKWTQHFSTRQPPSSAGHSATVQLGHYMIVFGGLHFTSSGHQCASSHAVWMFDFDTLEWEPKVTTSPHPQPRYGHSQIKLDDYRLLIIGGCGGPNMQHNDVWLLKMSTCPDDPWEWQEIQMKNKEYSASQLWSVPAVKVGSAVVVLNRSSSSGPSSHQIYQMQHQNRVLPEQNNNAHQNNRSMKSVSSADEKNVNGRKGTFKRGHHHLHSPASSSSSDEEKFSQSAGSKNFSGPSENSDDRFKPRANLNIGPSSNRRLPTVRLNSLSNRQRQLEILQRYELRIRNGSNLGLVLPQQTRNVQVRTRNCLQIHTLDISTVESGYVSWLPKSSNHIDNNDGPEDIVKYSLTVGNSEIIMFGGLYRNHDAIDHSVQSMDIVSNSLHFIKAKQFVI